jgi:hypothetical protein
MLSTHLYHGLPRDLLIHGFHQYPTCIPLLHYSCYMPCSSHPPWLHHPNYTSWRGQVMKLLKNNTYVESPITWSLLWLNILLSTLFSNIVSLCSHNIRDQVSHPYRTTKNYSLVDSNFYTLKTADKQTKGSGLNSSKH